MKKVGIVTFHCADNFGAVLQSYALRSYLTGLDMDVDVINYKPSYITNNYRIFPCLEDAKRYMQKGGLKYTLKELYIERLKTIKLRVKKRRTFESFRRKYVKVTGRGIKKSKKNCFKEYEYYIAGSDQIWNPKITNGVDGTYYFDFVSDDKIKISYAASFGTSLYTLYEKEMREKIVRFDYISIREKSCEEFAKRISDKNVETVVDPVFLMDIEHWNDVIDDKKRFEGEFILFYCFDKNEAAINMANKLSLKYNLPIIHYYFGNLRKKIIKDGKCFYFEGPLDFLWYIKNARCVVTSSFHCIAFSIIYKKQFYPFVYEDRGDRVVDLLNSLEINIPLYGYNTPIEQIKEYVIDYEKVHKKLMFLCESSKDFLDRALI